MQIYTGNGKGKTTAAVGLAARAAGRGFAVKFVQFMKGRESGEVEVLERLGVEYMRVSECKKFFSNMTEEEKAQARGDARRALAVISGWLGSADLIVLDEAMAALHSGILTEDEVLSLIDRRNGTELVLTGRAAPQRIVDAAHLVTEMREVKPLLCPGPGRKKGHRVLMVVLVTGGARSGKSAYAERLCKEMGGRVGYIAAAVVTDDDMRARVEAHRSQRPAEWVTFERYADFGALEREPEFAACDTFLLDCVSTMITNHMMDSGLDFDTCPVSDVNALEGLYSHADGTSCFH